MFVLVVDLSLMR